MRDVELLEQKLQYSRTIFDTVPLPVFIVDEEVRIQDYNAAAEDFLEPEPATALYCCAGDAFGCLNAEAAGCGRSEACKKCVIRNGVKKTIKGDYASREWHRMWLRQGRRTSEIDLLVTTSLLPYTDGPKALLILENLTELRKLQDLGAKRARKA